ncbi:MAG: amidohydrolase [Bacteroidales bacterium]|jgi:predicted amidohydrolase YtcJ|nr:amidohydrolase [Bacteroidales bacterium]
MDQLRLFIMAILMLSLAASCSNHKPEAELLFTDADIWTGNPRQPSAEAMAVSGDTIIAVGSNREILKYMGAATKITSLEGKFVVPGFIDSHIHFYQGGVNLTSVQLREAATPEAFISAIAGYAATLEPGAWIVGGDWDGKGWPTLPSREWIDEVTPHNPVFVTRLDGHMGLANSLAMKLAGVDRRTEDVPGGAIVRNSAGEPTGIFRDNAMDLITGHIPEPSGEQVEKTLLVAMDYLASNGITSVHGVDAGDYADAIARLRERGELITRVYAMTPVSRWESLRERMEKEGAGDKWLKYGAVKGFVDGSLGSHTAAFFEPYTDLPTDTGFFVNSEEDLYRWISAADRAGFQVVIHAIGDRANNFLLNLYERVAAENGPRDRRFRIEHAQHLLPSDIERFAGLGVIASMQPYHAIDDGRWAVEVIGQERIRTTYAFRSLIDAGAVVAFGSDWFVAPPTPIEGIYAAATRRTFDGKNPEGWVPEQKITVEQALKAYTLNAAYASFDEKIKGTLEAGKLADFTVLGDNILKTDPQKIWDTKVLMTFVGGKMVYPKQ